MRAKVRVSRGGHLIQTADYLAALESLEAAIDLARKAEERKIEAGATGNLGSV